MPCSLNRCYGFTSGRVRCKRCVISGKFCHDHQQLIGRGTTSRIIYIGNGRVAKLFKPTRSQSDIDNEISAHILAGDAGIAPKIYRHWDRGFDMQDLSHMNYITIRRRYRNRLIPRDICAQILSSIRQLHRLGVTHNDLHDNNIMIHKTTDKILLIDFGKSTRRPTQIQKDTEIINFTHSYCR